MGSTLRNIPRMMWSEMVGSERFRGHWVALDNVRYLPGCSKPVEADVVDVDSDLGELCARMRESERTSCSILFCEEEAYPPSTRRAVSTPPERHSHH